MKDTKSLGFATRAIHAGQVPDPSHGSIMQPIVLSSTYVQSSPGVHQGYDYTRSGNPTRKAYEDCLASLENGNTGFAFASGCAATTTIMHLLKQGDHVVAGDDMYGGTFRLFDKVIKNNGIEFSYVNLTDLSKIESQIKPNTKLIWIESPTNPTMKIIDIAEVVKRKGRSDILVAVDNTFMSPYFQRPLDLGADIVMHSATKFIGGHSDVVGGAVVVKDSALAERIAFYSNSIGGVQGPFDSYMCLRSLKTLPVRMKAHAINAQKIAEYLEEHSMVEKVLYPGLKSHPHYEIGQKQMSGSGGMITFYIKGGIEPARKFLESVEVFSLAESLGGVESLIEHPAIMTHASVPADRRKELGIDDSLIRLSVGIEELDDLLKDLDQAFKKANS